MHPECYDDEIHSYMRKDDNLFGWNTMHYTKNPEESKVLNTSEEPALLLQLGMANAGRIKHHLFPST